MSAALKDDVSASASLGWLLIANKPFYPLYVWWLTGHGLSIACLTMISAPAYAALLYFRGRDGLLLRAGVPALGAFDSLAAAKIFGAEAGTEMFLAPCALLLAVALRRSEKWIALALGVALSVAFIGLHRVYGAPLHAWSADELAALFSLNAYAAACVCLFILWKFGDLPRA